MTRIARVSAVMVAIRSSGQMIVAVFVSAIAQEAVEDGNDLLMIEAGTTMPPIPRPARTRMPQSW